ncbi:ABC transporter permease [Luteimonas sp. FXH3W]|uniref:ABC transporter permease n=1 Tax=Aquilutibacter rugosus TaxID=3115820 RepID=A0ABU7UXT6_9GAMM
MKYLHLIGAALFRSKLRTFLTMFSVVVAFALFGMLDSVRDTFANSGKTVEGANRMIVSSKLSLTQMLPASLEQRLKTVPGITRVSTGSWFGGYYQDPKQFFPNFAVDPDYFLMYPEYEVAPQQLKDWQATRNGVIVGESLLKKFNWKVGQDIPLQATIFPTKGGNTWTFKISGIFRAKDRKRVGEENSLVFHWQYFDEANDYVKGRVGWYAIAVDSPDNATRIAKAVDALSMNSDAETKTETEAAFQQSFVKQIGDIGKIVTYIMGAVFFTLLMLTGNTMAQAVRERIPELAVLKTIGFSNRAVLWMVLAESLILVIVAGLIGMVAATVLMKIVATISGGMMPINGLGKNTWLLGLGLMVAFGLLVGLLPAMRAMRLNIVDALAGR